MNRKTRKHFDFLPLVHELIGSIIGVDGSDKSPDQIASQLKTKMEDAKEFLNSISGLDLTEEEQNQRITELNNLIEKKRALIEVCTTSLESWHLPSETQPET